jgi:DGQHR domain-containing protein
VPRSVIKKLVTRSNADIWRQRGWQVVGEEGGMLWVRRKLAKWQKFEMRVREFLRDIMLDDRIDVDDFGFTKYGGYQLDACGGLEHHFILIDCTTTKDPRERSLRDKIKDFHNKQPDFERDLKEKFGKKYTQLHYVVCTQDIEVSDSDERYAADRGIRIVPSETLEEWMKVGQIASPTIAFQVIEYIVGQKIPMPSGRPFRFPAIELPLSASDDGRKLYAFTTTPDQLLRLGFVYRLGYRDTQGYQRALKIPKLRLINQFLTEDSHNGFPTSLLVSFDETAGTRLKFEPLEVEEGGESRSRLGTLVVPPYFGIAEIIDGQHRLFGYHDFSKSGFFRPALDSRRKNDQLLVVAYPDPNANDRPRLFLDINSNQTKISSRQVWAMMGKSRPNSQMGFISNLVRGLNASGPLQNRIQVPGVTRGTRYLNIANVGKGIQDRRLLDDSTAYAWNLFEGVRGSDSYPSVPPQTLFKTLNAFFYAARDSAEADWIGSPSFLQSNNGVNVMLRVLVEILKYNHAKARPRALTRADFRSYLSPVLSRYIREKGSRRLVRRTSTEAVREEVAAEIIGRISKRIRGFAAVYLAERKRRMRGNSA